MLSIERTAGPVIAAIHGAGQAVPDSIRVESPLPGGVATVVRFLFNVPRWIQITGLVIGVLVAGAVLATAWRYRVAIIAWLRSRPRPVGIAMLVALSLAVIGSAAGGAWGWHYSQHDNGFCTGCHVMGPAFTRFTQSQHAKLECHSCHQQSIFASARQLYLWVAERPAEIGPHAKVPTRVCAGCHESGDAARWKQIAATAGHRTHLESDSSALRGVQCVTCHGVEVHQFAPVSQTCAQSGCHVGTTIKLGGMASQTSLHCVTCHNFTAPVPALATRDSAAGTLTPSFRQCLDCHAMRATVTSFDTAKDPHGGTCGMCHNPHTQTRAAEAALTCASAQCHAAWRDEPFHVGVRHRNVATQCTLCHQPHQAKVDPSDCAGCHQAVAGRRAGRRTLAPPVPFDTTRALRGDAGPGGGGGPSASPDDVPPRGKGDIPPPQDRPQRVSARVSARAAPDTFPHARHTTLACITCHASQKEHGTLTFEQPRGCQICHHQNAARATCATCHRGGDLAAAVPANIRVAVAGAPVRERTVAFDHARHQALACTACHTTPVTLEPGAEVKTCAACHQAHHGAERTCGTCHRGETLATAHQPWSATHVRCDRCHDKAVVASLVPARPLCLTCHQAQQAHYAGRECTTCHFQASPEAFRAHLASGSAAQ